MVERADVSQLGSVANSLRPVGDGISRAADNVHRTIHGLDWTGQARVEAIGRADSEKSQMYGVSGAVTNLRTALTNGQSVMAPMVDSLKSSARNLEAASYDVADNWTVTDAYKYGLAEAFAAGDKDEQARIEELKRQRAEEARNATVRLTRLAQDLEAADTACANAVRGANEEITAMAPIGAGLVGGQAAGDLKAMRAGSMTPEQAARLRAATTLTPQQLEELREGRPAFMSQGQFDYLKSLMGEFDGVSLQEMKDIDERNPGALGDALRLMSIPNVHTVGGESGGMNRLPVGVQTLLREKAVRTDTVVANGQLRTFTDIPRLDDFKALNGLLGDGNQGLRLGADIDRGLLKQAAEIGGNMSPRGADTNYGNYHHAIDASELRETVDAMFQNGAGDHQAVADFLTGDNMDVTVTAGSHYNADDHIWDLMTTKWEPDELGAKSVMSWFGDSAGASGHEGVAAGRSMEALSDFIVRHEHQLTKLDLGDDQYTTFGQRNPELAQAIARSAAPYIGNYFGLPDDMLVNHTVGPLGKEGDFASLLSVLGTDGTAGEMMVRSSSAWENHIAHEFGDDPRQSGLGVAAGQMHRAVEAGIDDLDTTLTDNHQWNENVDFNARGEKIDGVLALLQGSGVPGLSDAATIAGPAIKGMELGDPPGDPREIKPWSSQIENYRDTHQQLTTGVPRSYLMIEPFLVDHPELVDRNWNGDGKGPIDFFDSNGDLDWNTVVENRSRFTTFYDQNLGVLDDNFNENTTSLVGGSQIDLSKEPEPNDSRRPPS
ncbi:hypothetical protein QSJ19_16435 [Gordonia sp. ABSL11-1]|uniref:TPR repeat region-containing protein n=1 Tax=Gordonia sp. ABSL11-1 TaxID=3053924 RepID=UPI0025730921|nr:hypothetical protein [Gordonia sp. ABSL11-1]MDL9947143.1 hypothetical protein [Gordonia sp. ABSL11-1]